MLDTSSRTRIRSLLPVQIRWSVFSKHIGLLVTKQSHSCVRFAKEKSDTPVGRIPNTTGCFYLIELLSSFRTVLTLKCLEEEDIPDHSNLDEEIERQIPLIVLNGDDPGLIAPVTLDHIKAHSLPAERDNTAISDGVQRLRVPLLTTVRSILDLERTEKAAFPSPYIATDRSICPHSGTVSFGNRITTDWIDGISQKMKGNGLNDVKEARQPWIDSRHRDEGKTMRPNSLNSCYAGKDGGSDTTIGFPQPTSWVLLTPFGLMRVAQLYIYASFYNT